jgi:hypothetical protein
MTDITSQAEAALGESRWSDALDLIDAAGSDARSPALLELRARAAYGNGDLEASIAAWEELHTLLCERDDHEGAARAAAMVAMFLMIDTGLMAPVRGWLRRAEALVDAVASPVHAVTAAIRGYERFMCGDIAAAREESARAIELGNSLGSLPAEVIGRTAAARITILEDDVEDGLAQLDEVGGLLMSGAVDPLTTGMMLCEIICAAQGLGRHDLAMEWTAAMDRWRPGAAFGGIHGRCRVHRAEILRVTGPSEAAEDEALGACDDLRPWMRREFGWPLAELGTIRLRRGDLAGAEEALLAAFEHVWCPHPGLALVRLAQGDGDTAAALIEEAISHPFRTPSKERPPFGDLTLAPLFEAQNEIACATGDAEVAHAAATSLRAIATMYRSPWLQASASLAEARAALLVAAVDQAADAAASAVAGWADLGAPYETAVARMTLAAAKHRTGQDLIARMEWQAAATGFDDYGAPLQAARARAHLERAASPSVPTSRSAPATFARDGDMRIISFGGRSVALHDLKGFRYLHRMLGEPGREFHVLDLVAVEQGTLPTGVVEAVGAAEVDGASGGALPTLDDQARRAYRRRLDDIDEDIADARRCHDDARAELAERDREFLISELARAVGLGGRLRTIGSDAERARTAVTRTLRYAVARLGSEIPELASHLDNSLHTGTYCSYRPDPLSPVDWSD